MTTYYASDANDAWRGHEAFFSHWLQYLEQSAADLQQSVAKLEPSPPWQPSVQVLGHWTFLRLLYRMGALEPPLRDDTTPLHPSHYTYTFEEVAASWKEQHDDQFRSQ